MKKKLEEKQAPPLPTPTPTIVSHSVFMSNCKDMETQTDTSFLPKTHFKTFNDNDLLSNDEKHDKSTQTSPPTLDSIEINVTSPKTTPTLPLPSSSLPTTTSKSSPNNVSTSTKSNTTTLTSYSTKPLVVSNGTKKATETISSTLTKTTKTLESSPPVNSSSTNNNSLGNSSSISSGEQTSITSTTPNTSSTSSTTSLNHSDVPQQPKQEEPPLDLDDPDFAVRRVVRTVKKKQSEIATPSNSHATTTTMDTNRSKNPIELNQDHSSIVSAAGSSLKDGTSSSEVNLSTAASTTEIVTIPEQQSNLSHEISPTLTPQTSTTNSHSTKTSTDKTTNSANDRVDRYEQTKVTHQVHAIDHSVKEEPKEQVDDSHKHQPVISSLEYTRGDSPIFYDIEHFITKDEPPEEPEEEKALHQHQESTWYKTPKSGHTHPMNHDDKHEKHNMHHSSTSHHQIHHHSTQEDHSSSLAERIQKQARLKKVTFSHHLDDGEKMEILESKFKKRNGMSTLVDRVLVSQEGKQLRIHGYNDYYYDEHGNLVYDPNHNRTNQNSTHSQDDKQGVRGEETHTNEQTHTTSDKGTTSTKLNVIIRKNLRQDQHSPQIPNNAEEGVEPPPVEEDQEGNNNTLNKRGKNTPYGIHFGKLSYNKSSTIDNKNNMHPFTGRSHEEENQPSNNFSRNGNNSGNIIPNSVVRYGKKYFNSRDLMGNDGVDYHSDPSTLYIGKNPYSSNITNKDTNNGTSIHFDVNSQYAISNFPNRKSRPNSSQSNHQTSSGHNSPTKVSQIFVSLGQHIEHSNSQKEKRLKELKQEEQDKLEKILTTWNQMSKGHPESIEKLKEEYMNQLLEEEAHYYDIKESKVVSPSKKGGKSQLFEKDYATFRYSSNDLVNTYQSSMPSLLPTNITSGTDEDSKVELNDTTITINNVNTQDTTAINAEKCNDPAGSSTIEFDLSDERANPTEMIMRPLLKIKRYQSPPKSNGENISNNSSLDMTTHSYDQMLSMYMNQQQQQNSSPSSSPSNLNRMQSSSSTCTVTLHQAIPINHNPTLISTNSKSLPSVIPTATNTIGLTNITTTPRIGAVKGRRITPTPPPTCHSMSSTTNSSTTHASSLAPLSSRESRKSSTAPYVISRSKSAMGSIRERDSSSTSTRKKIKTSDSVPSLRSSMPTSGRSVSVADEREISKRKLKSLVGQ